MFNILLLTPKHLLETSVEKLTLAITTPTILFTGIEAQPHIKRYEKLFNQIFAEIIFFENYIYSDLIEKTILIVAEKRPISKIVALAEVDILRAAISREKLKIVGQTIENALSFRDKYKMKQLVSSSGIPVPKYCLINNTFELIDFINLVSYPVIIKPVAGRGSAGTFIIKNETMLDKYLTEGLFTKFDCNSGLLAEQFIHGDVYHVDGLVIDGKLIFISPSQYINNCLNFLHGSILGSVTLHDDNILKNKLIQYAQQILFNALSIPKNSLFHIEFFVDASQNIFFCEAASRLGGGNINEQIFLAYNYDIKTEFLQSELSNNYAYSGNHKQENVVGRLLIPPRKMHILKDIPRNCPFDIVKSYHTPGIINKPYQDVTMSNQEIAHFIFTADSEKDAINNMHKLCTWFNKEVVWQPINPAHN